MLSSISRYYSDEEFRAKFLVDRNEFLVNRRLLNQNQVLAAQYFVRRLHTFLKVIATRKDVLGGTLKDYVIRYETQGRGSVLAHMLWWIDIDQDYIRPDDWIDMERSVLEKYGLVKVNEVNQSDELMFDRVLLVYMNANVWALRNVWKVAQKLDIEPVTEERYVHYGSVDMCHDQHVP